MPTPDVRVRLSAEGTAEVVAALKKVQSEASVAGQKGAKGFGLLNGVLGQAKGLLAGLGIALGVRQLVGFAQAGGKAAESQIMLAQKMGTSITNASALSYAAQKSAVEVTALSTSFGFLSKQIVALNEGSPETAETFRQLGISAEDIKGLDTAQVFDLVAKRMAKMQDGAAKTTLAIKLFTKAGSQLVPLLNDIGERGLAAVVKEAKALGVVLEDDLVKAAAALDDQFDTLKKQSESLAIQFASGLAPSLIQAFRIINPAIKTSGEGWKKFGEIVGWVVKHMVFAVASNFSDIADYFDFFHTRISQVLIGIRATWEAESRLIRGDAEGAAEQARKAWDAIQKAESDYESRSAKRTVGQRARLQALREKPTPEPGASGTADANAQDEAAALNRILQHRLAMQRAALDAEVALQKAKGKLRTEADQRAFDDGLIDLEEYYRRRKETVNRELDAEKASLLHQKALLTQEPDEQRRESEGQKIDAALALLEVQRAQTMAGLDDDRLKRTRELGEQRFDFERKIAELQGRTHQVAMVDMEEEAQKLDLLLRQQGVDPETRARQGQRLRDALKANADFDQAKKNADAALADLDLARGEIQAKVEAGQISTLQGESQILQVEQDRLVVVNQLADALLKAAEATGDPEKIRQAQEFVLSIQNLGVAVSQAGLLMKNFAEDVQGALTDDLSNWLATNFEQAQTFKGAMKDLALSVLESLRRISAQIIATAAIERASGLFGFMGGGKSLGTEVNPEFGRAAAGGLLQGPGTGTSDSIPIRASAGEFIVRAAAVRQPGMLAHLAELNRLQDSFHLRPLPTPRTFAMGGLVANSGAGAGGAGQGTGAVGRDGRLLIGLDEGLVLKAFQSPEGQKVLIQSLAKNRRAVQSITGR